MSTSDRNAPRPRPTTILGIADEERPALTVPGAVDFGPGNRPDLLLSAGDLDFGYVTAVADGGLVDGVVFPAVTPPRALVRHFPHV
ncbi:MAG TPA: hypothetical protein GXZ46_09735, partial [Actinomycetales bacterium]|nr:hypothetical protein [Actinomycetales bacterium]